MVEVEAPEVVPPIKILGQRSNLKSEKYFEKVCCGALLDSKSTSKLVGWYLSMMR